MVLVLGAEHVAFGENAVSARGGGDDCGDVRMVQVKAYVRA